MRQEFFGYKILRLALFIIFSITIQAQPDRALTWQDNYFPQFNISIKPGDLEKLLAEGETSKFPITLNYQGNNYDGTIRQRGTGSSYCGDKRQFRIDFTSKHTLPDGYRTDRFETDRGSCYVMHEWLAWRLLDKAAAWHPELKLLRKKSNLLAIYFNGELYHVQTLLEDVSKDVIEPQLGTRNYTAFKSGCYGRLEPQADIDAFCADVSPASLKSVMEVKSFLYSTAAIQVLGSQDNYPSYPYNYYFIQTTSDKRFWFMPDDLDQTLSSDAGPYWNPYMVSQTNYEWQGQYLALLNDPESRQAYNEYVRELTEMLRPEEVKPMIEAKYLQIRDTLLASPNLPISPEFYDYIYQNSLPYLIDERYKYLQLLAPDEGMNHEPTAKIVEIPSIIESSDSEGILLKLDGSLSTDPDSNPLTYVWNVDSQEIYGSSILEINLAIGTHTISLKVNDGRGGESVTTPFSIQIIPKVEVVNKQPTARMVELPSAVESTYGESVYITLDGSPSTDPDGDTLSYTWYLDNQEIAQTVITGVYLSPGLHTITLTAQDGKGGVNTTVPFYLEVVWNQLTVNSVDRPYLQKRTNQTLTIRGAGFETGARISLGSDVNVDVPFSSTTTSLSVRLFVMSSAAVGARDVVVINPDGKVARLRYGIYIE
jgi:CotH kinase protein/PKD domain